MPWPSSCWFMQWHHLEGEEPVNPVLPGIQMELPWSGPHFYRLQSAKFSGSLILITPTPLLQVQTNTLGLLLPQELTRRHLRHSLSAFLLPRCVPKTPTQSFPAFYSLLFSPAFLPSTRISPVHSICRARPLTVQAHFDFTPAKSSDEPWRCEPLNRPPYKRYLHVEPHSIRAGEISRC